MIHVGGRETKVGSKASVLFPPSAFIEDDCSVIEPTGVVDCFRGWPKKRIESPDGETNQELHPSTDGPRVKLVLGTV
jgi:hypothetical protein